MTRSENNGGFYITTPIYYVNDVPHIGHAYTTIACDALARWHRTAGHETRFLTGTDEHGQKIEQAAQKRGMTPIELCDEVVVNIQKLWPLLEVSNDDFIRTTEERHAKVVQYFFKTLLDKGDIYKGDYEGWYCLPCETYFTDAQAGDQRACPDCGRPLTRMSEESYFFRLSNYAGKLIAHYEAHPDAIMPKARYNEVLSFIRGGLQDLSVSRTTLKWGISVPGDDKHVIYVWLDALVNYISALGYPQPGGLWETHWPNARHMVGKDIIRFHAVIWPAILMAMGLNPPVRVFAHGWWTVEGDKMSKSKGNVVDPFEMTELYGADAFRYFLLREVPFGNDGDFSELAMAHRINSDLANDLGNLLNRTLQMIEKYRGGALPADGCLACAKETDRSVALAADAAIERMKAEMDEFALDSALKTLWTLISAGNKYIDETEPWKLGNKGRDDQSEPEGRLDVVLRTLWEILRLAAILLHPFMPETAAEIWAQLGLDRGAFSSGEALLSRWQWGRCPSPVIVKKGPVLFPRIDISKWKEEKARRDAAKRPAAEHPSVVPVAPAEKFGEISIADFKKLEIRVAMIERVETVEKSDKLYKLLVDLGAQKRVIVSGIREQFSADELTGKRILVICNLKPAKLRGITSEGMLLTAEATKGGKAIYALATVDDNVPLGSLVG
ncbi:MAG: methionine--tRNA ligase [Synergistaceae bacterium]|jgi:methionyl-tRNA synthetase|nr:methionine--tRNA ligase [Synergistaceae bacterium]